MRNFPGGPVVETLPSNAEGAGLIPGLGAKIPHALWLENQDIRKLKQCNKFNKDFKNGPHDPGEENGNALQYSYLGNPMDRGAWWATF